MNAQDKIQACGGADLAAFGCEMNAQDKIQACGGADLAAFGLAVMLEQTMRLVYPERSPQDMHPGQWAALRFLARANKEARTVLGLARYLGITQGPASRAVAALERKALLAGERDSKDRRVVRLELTSAGRALLSQDPIQRLAGLLKSMPELAQQDMAQRVADLFQGLALRSDVGSGATEAMSPFLVPTTDSPV
jgi:DNA-binding MarR family transcriptional regulator